MIKIYRSVLFIVLLISFQAINILTVNAQDAGDNISGVVYEAGLGTPLSQAIISNAITGESVIADENGKFSIAISDKLKKLLISLPGYHTSSVMVGNNTDVVVYLTKKDFKSDDELYSTPVAEYQLKDAVNSVVLLNKKELDMPGTALIDQTFGGKVAGMQVIEHSGVGGHNTWINIRGISSIYGKNEPLVFVDGMIHETRYPLHTLSDGYMYDPFELIDPDDVVNITVSKNAESSLGSAGSNGTIYINTEQSKETSAAIKFKISEGISLRPSSLEVMDANQYRSYFTNMLNSQGYTAADINTMYPWLNGGPESSNEYYRYNNNTDWQDEMYKTSSYQKYHLLIKGGDDIATYNLSTGYVRQGSGFEDWRYSRYNLRLNGKINISNRFSVIPNTKLSLSDSYLTNMGPSTTTNPVLASLLNPPLSAPYVLNDLGEELAHFEDVSVFNTSNPAAIIANSVGKGKNVHLIGSINAIYKISPKLTISNLTGFNFNNDRESNFIPNVGVVTEGIIENSPRSMVTELRSTQNFTTITYNDRVNEVHNININAGQRVMVNSYKNNLAIDYNTPSDDFISLGKGSGFEYLRVSTGEVSSYKWLSYFGQINYNYVEKYYLSSSVSLDATSVTNSENRYNFYPSVLGAWKMIENNSQTASFIDEVKMKASWGISGNMFSPVYKYSDLYYTGRRYENLSVVIRDYNPNFDMQMEKKSSINAGFDILMGKKSIQLGIEYYNTMVNNLIINQELPFQYGFTNYYDNGGKLSNSGIELSLNAVKQMGDMALIFDAAVASQFNKVTSLDFIDPETSSLIANVYGAEYIVTKDNAIPVFWGYKTNGIYASTPGVTGPNKNPMVAGDVNFVEVEANNVIDDNDKQIIGNPNPDLFGGFSAGLAYKMIEVSANFTFSYGNDIYNYVRSQLIGMDDYANQSPDVLTDASLPRMAFGDPSGNNVFSDRWIEDGSYLKLKEIKVSYDLSGMVKYGKEFKLFLSGTNLLTLTKYSGYDPELMYLNSPFLMGMDFGKIPPLKTFVIGINLGL